ncbi:glycosyltransferase family 4 protein [Romboutsia timonensis]|uniref:glycosyltransferase family 4 protein n=1 Tax=Romboutsia timonensis TaxID=1776391 RepID=UPI002A8223AE|nr:glycosyltransferase family 4 protein [Romboutsia timonensis]MDY3959068.1 glycosyltransferase family 4 protein [Romboutsia timonensis]
MKILVSAYACEPNKGSEPAVGWNWTKNLSQRHKVFVITRENNKKNIESVFNNENIQFYYYDLPKIFKKLKAKTGFTLIYYYLWQLGAYKIAKEISRKEKIDLAHHVTFANFKIFSYLAFLNMPFVYGPVGGGERAPKAMYRRFSVKHRLKEIARDLDIYISRFNILTLYTWYKADKILVTTEETLSKIPKKFRAKAEVAQTIGIEENFINSLCQNEAENNKEIEIGYVGNLLEWKGIDILIDSFNIYLKEYNESAILTIVGDGPGKLNIIKKIKNYGIEKNINFVGKVNRIETIDLYKRFNTFVFPSLHDSGGMVVLEAMACSVPVIVLNLGGPGNNVKYGCGVKVDFTNYENVINEIAFNINKLNSDSGFRNEIIYNSQKHIRKFLWNKKVNDIEKIYIEVINNKKLSKHIG